MTQVGEHIPVLFCETLDALAIREGGRYVDGTLGRAGHTREILRRGGCVLGIDRDDDALLAVREQMKNDPQLFANLTTLKSTHGNLAQDARAHGWLAVDGILLDLGVSSPQLDEAHRGFSFMKSGPLDMRMNQASGETAADVVNNASVEELSRIFRELGEEPQAFRLAKTIVAAREKKKFAMTDDLSELVSRTIGRHGAHHPATRVFQALRMHVNDEIGELERALRGGLDLLAPGGRFAVITFESITDRIVKQFFARHIGKKVSLQQGGERWEGDEPKVCAITRHAVRASEEEQKFNPRARSAKLRVVEKTKEVQS